jgi:hypothetical protein
MRWIQAVPVETANQSVIQGLICGSILLRMARFRPVLTEVLFIDRQPEDGAYEPLIGYIPLKQALISPFRYGDGHAVAVSYWY